MDTIASAANEQRESYWNYLIKENVGRPIGVTQKRLEKIKDEVLADGYFGFK